MSDDFDKAVGKVLDAARRFADFVGRTDHLACLREAVRLYQETSPRTDLEMGLGGATHPDQGWSWKPDVVSVPLFPPPPPVDPNLQDGQLRLVIDQPHPGHRYVWNGTVAHQSGRCGFGLSLDLTLEDLISRFETLPAPDTVPGDKPWRGWVHFLRLREPDTTVEIDVVRGGVYRLAKKLR